MCVCMCVCDANLLINNLVSIFAYICFYSTHWVITEGIYHTLTKLTLCTHYFPVLSDALCH